MKKKKNNKSGRSTGIYFLFKIFSFIHLHRCNVYKFKFLGSSSSFPIDFFEYCVAMNEIEFGGNDLLQIYNPQQIKNRLNSNGKDNKKYLTYFIF